MPDVQHKRGTRAALNTLAGASGLKVGQVYVITDESRLAVALTVSTYQTYAKQGEDIWNRVGLASDFSNSTVTFNTITGFTFAPSANTNFRIEAELLLQTATATVLPRVGVAWGTGLLHGAVMIDQTGATATTRVIQDGSLTTGASTIQVPAGGFATANLDWPALVTIWGRAGASPQAISVQLASETAGTAVKAMMGSEFRTRTSA